MTAQLPLKNSSEKIIWGNNLRSLATVGVIMLHVVAPLNSDFNTASVTNWWIGNLLGVTTRWCVPIFIMLSGSFALTKYDGNLQNFFGKTFKRLVLPFLFWSIFYLLYYNGKALLTEPRTATEKIMFVLKAIISGSAVHLWFVSMILSMYILFPFISKLTTYCSNKELLLFLVCWFMYITLQPFTEDVNTDFDFTFFSGFVGYLILGNYLFKLSIKPNKVLLYLLLTASYAYTAYGTFYFTKKNNELDENLLRSLTPNIIILSTSVYLLFKNTSFRLPDSLQKFSNTICENSYGIFLIHILVLTLFNNYGIQYNLFNPVISVPFITLLCFSISFILVLLLKKIPYLKELIG